MANWIHVPTRKQLETRRLRDRLRHARSIAVRGLDSEAIVPDAVLPAKRQATAEEGLVLHGPFGVQMRAGTLGVLGVLVLAIAGWAIHRSIQRMREDASEERAELRASLERLERQHRKVVERYERTVKELRKEVADLTAALNKTQDTLREIERDQRDQMQRALAPAQPSTSAPVTLNMVPGAQVMSSTIQALPSRPALPDYDLVGLMPHEAHANLTARRGRSTAL